MFEDIFAGPVRLLMTVGLLVAAAFVVLTVLRLRSAPPGKRVRAFPYARRSGLEVFGKVRLEDVIVARSGLSKSDRMAARNRIKSRHLDFVLVDPASMRVMAAVELDDASHKSARAQEADMFKDGALAAAGVPLIRVRAASSYSVVELERQIGRGVEPVARARHLILPGRVAW